MNDIVLTNSRTIIINFCPIIDRWWGPPQRRSCKRELAFFRSWIRENEKKRSWIRENDVVRDSWKEEILFKNSWKLKNLFVNSWIPIHSWFVIREMTKSRSWNRATRSFSIVREFVKIKNIVCEFVKIKNIVREFVSRTPLGGHHRN